MEMTITYLNHKFRKYAVQLFVILCGIFLSSFTFFVIQLIIKQWEREALVHLYNEENTLEHKWRNFNRSNIVEWSYRLSERNSYYDREIWVVREFTDCFIADLDNSLQSKQAIDVRKTVEKYRNALIERLVPLNNFTREQKEFFWLLSESHSLDATPIHQFILKKHYQIFKDRASYEANMQKIKREIRLIEEGILYFYFAVASSPICRYYGYSASVEGQSSLLTNDTLKLKLGLIDLDGMNQYYQLITAEDTLAIDSHAPPIIKIKTEAVGKHTLEGIIMKKDGWGRIGRYPFEHQYTVTPN